MIDKNELIPAEILREFKRTQVRDQSELHRRAFINS